MCCSSPSLVYPLNPPWLRYSERYPNTSNSAPTWSRSHEKNTCFHSWDRSKEKKHSKRYFTPHDSCFRWFFHNWATKGINFKNEICKKISDDKRTSSLEDLRIQNFSSLHFLEVSHPAFYDHFLFLRVAVKMKSYESWCATENDFANAFLISLLNQRLFIHIFLRLTTFLLCFVCLRTSFDLDHWIISVLWKLQW
jgi:hypothetical protein